jgi:hypothetical protein
VVLPWVKWSSLAIPKYLGGWGLKNIFLFAKGLAAKSCWRLVSSENIWTQVVTHKYISLSSLQDWIRSPIKKNTTSFIIWKAVTTSFDVVEEGLAWRIGNGNKVHLGLDPWPG